MPSPSTSPPTLSAANSGAADFCSSCICALTGVYAPALAASGINLAPDAAAGNFPLDTATSIISACTAEFFAQMLLANVNTTALQGLTQCDYSSTAALPPCLNEQLAALTPATTAANTSVTASARADDPATATTAAPTLRVATVLPTATGAQITLAGQLDSAEQLLTAMAASTDLRAALPVAKLQALDTLAESATTFQDDPAVAQLLSTITADPFSAESIIDGLTPIAANAQGTAAPASTTTADVAAATPAVVGAAVVPSGNAAAAPAAKPNSASSNMLGFVVALLTAGAALAMM